METLFVLPLISPAVAVRHRRLSEFQRNLSRAFSLHFYLIDSIPLVMIEIFHWTKSGWREATDAFVSITTYIEKRFTPIWYENSVFL